MERKMGPAARDFEDFYLEWSITEKKYLKMLQDSLASSVAADKMRILVEEVQRHYECYYLAENAAAKLDVLRVLAPTWETYVDFMWIGGFRPTKLFHLVYAQAGQQARAELADSSEDFCTPSNTWLTARQLQKISDLQIDIQEQEDCLTERMLNVQYGPSLTQAERNNKLEELEGLLVAANELRKDALARLLVILTAVQAVQYLAIGIQLHIVKNEAETMVWATGEARKCSLVASDMNPVSSTQFDRSST